MARSRAPKVPRTTAEWWARACLVVAAAPELERGGLDLDHWGQMPPEDGQPAWAWPSGGPGALLAHPLVIEAVQVWNAKEVSPLGGWPHEWSAWVVEGVIALEAAMSAQARERVEQASR